MKITRLFRTFLGTFWLLGACGSAYSQITISTNISVGPGNEKPTWVSISGLSGEALQTLQFDLYVQGFNFTNSEGAQYLISGSNNGNLTGRVTDKYTKQSLVSKSYSGSSLRRQVHAFADDFVVALQRKPIAQTKIAFRGENGPASEIYVADFDGHNAQPVTKDGSLAVSPTWVPHRLALYYVSYKHGNPDIWYHNLSTGERRVFARYAGSNMSPAPSPDVSKVAMILSKDGWTDLYVGGSDGSAPRRLTKSPQDESSPCWSPDGRWICYASKDRERRSLSKIAPEGGTSTRIPTIGSGTPMEPDWSPDGQWIVFTTLWSNFSVCVVKAGGGAITSLVNGEDACWAPNSRTVVFTRRVGGHRVLSLLDVPTKQFKDVSRISGISSQSQPNWEK
jgi:TolB protein